MGPQALPTGVFGLLYPNVFDLIVGRSSVAMQGLQSFPGVMDTDYQGEIKVMAKAIYNIVTIPTGRRIAQLLLLPLLPTNHKYKSPKRGDQGFSSSDAYWLNKNL